VYAEILINQLHAKMTFKPLLINNVEDIVVFPAVEMRTLLFRNHNLKKLVFKFINIDAKCS